MSYKVSLTDVSALDSLCTYIEDQSHCILCDSFLPLVTLGVALDSLNLIIMQRPTHEYKRITLNLTPGLYRAALSLGGELQSLVFTMQCTLLNS